MALGLESLPAGTPIDVENVNELEVGDKIHVTFPTFSLGRVAYGSEVTLLIFAKTHDGKICLKDPSGKTLSPLGGTKEDLLKMLSEQTSYDTVTIVRPPEVAAKILAAQGASPSQIALAGYREKPIGSLFALGGGPNLDDSKLLYASANGNVVFKVEDVDFGNLTVTATLEATDDPARQVQIGKEFTFGQADLPASVWKVYDRPVAAVTAMNGFPWLMVVLGVLAAAGVAVAIYLRKKS